MKSRGLILVLVMLISCGQPGKNKSGQTADPSDRNQSLGASKAGAVIQYNNAMVTYMSDAGAKIGLAGADFEKMAAMVSTERKESFKGVAFSGIAPDAQKQIDGVVLTEGTGLPSDVKVTMILEVKATDAAFKKAQSTYNTFKAYLDEDAFLEDDWKKGKALVLAMKEHITLFYRHQEKAYLLLRPIASEAENQLLESHPLREAILATKTDLSLAGKILELLGEQELNLELINAQYATLETNRIKHQNLIPEKLKAQQKQKNYADFYARITDFLTAVNKGKNDAQISADELRSIQKDYSRLMQSYNNFS